MSYPPARVIYLDEGGPVIERDHDIEAYGRRAVANGELLALRERLGLTVNAMAEFLGTTQNTYRSWEENLVTRMWPQTAQRIGRFILHANRHLDFLESHGVSIDDLIPLHKVAGQLGIPHEILIKRYREGLFAADDLGILGLWVDREDIKEIAGVL